MEVKLIAVDIDGTLITPDKRITPRVRDILRYVENKGIMVSLVTGRLYPTCKKYALELGLSGPCVIYQGAMIIDHKTDKVLHELRIPKDKALEIVRYSRENNLSLNVYMDQFTFYTEKPNRYSILDAQLNEVELQVVKNLEDIITDDPLKLMFVEDPKTISKLEEIFSSLDEEITALTSLPQFLEIVNKNATKADALKWIADRFNIKREEIMAIGDSHNDIPMIEWAGIGVAMGNADEKVKNSADFITLSNTEDGVAYAIELLIIQNLDLDRIYV
ncbi:MAG: Cof-type HAD-IIB family hydrolase [bacterium]|nr:Cof-type HAD-IIB family hydrolase [bacterium]